MKYVYIIQSGIVDGIAVFSTLKKAYSVYKKSEPQAKSIEDVFENLKGSGSFLHESSLWETRIFIKEIDLSLKS